MKKRILLGMLLLLTLPVVHLKEAEATVTSTSSEIISVSETSSSTTESSTETTGSSSTDTNTSDSSTGSSAPAAHLEEDVATFVEDQIGVPATEDETVTPGTTVEEIREALVNDYLTEEKLDTYTDEQLTNALTLFERYNNDVYGMDLGAYVDLLEELYDNKTLDWTVITEQLSFVPQSLTYEELINQVDALQAYLKALYPENSAFLSSKSMSNDELVGYLEYLKTYEKEPFPGKMAWIMKLSYDGIPPEETSTSTSETNDSSSSSSSSTSTSSSSAASQQSSSKAAAATNDKGLPITGEQKTILFSVIGVVIIAIIAFVLYRRKQANK